jgi:hypothetical protein
MALSEIGLYVDLIVVVQQSGDVDKRVRVQS